MIDDNDRLDRLIDSWSEESSSHLFGAGSVSGNPSEDSNIQALREVARIAEFNRSVQRVDRVESGAMPERWGDLLLLERIRFGSTADVFRAWEPGLEREVALKLLRGDSPPGGASWIDEARAVARVAHRNVVTVYGAAQHEGRGGVWMEYLRGETLAEAIERAGPVSPPEVIRIGQELGEALRAVHAAGLVHGDVKPANVVLEAGGRVVLTDFGLGRRWSRDEGGAFTISGTPLFLSPERLDGGPATPKSDQYALGVTLWFAMTGRYPHEARTLDELREAVRAGPSRHLRTQSSGVPSSLVSAIERSVMPEPSSRHASIDAFVAALAGDITTPSRSPSRRHGRARWALATVIAAGVIVAGIVALRGRGATRDTVAIHEPVENPTSAPVTTYDIEATFIRRNQDEYKPLASGDRVRLGDDVSLEFRSSLEMWVYVLDEDERGETFLLFPQPLFDHGNPIPPRSSVTLPGSIGGRQNAWKVTSRGGREHLLLVANSKPIPELEAELARLPAPRPGTPVQYAPVGEPVIEQLRGMGGVEEVHGSSPPASSRAFDRFRSLAGRETGVRGVWVRTVVLENPVR